jgi:hypothetical protein
VQCWRFARVALPALGWKGLPWLQRKRKPSKSGALEFREKIPDSDILPSEVDIDQRLEKLTELHEALAETMELVVHMHQKNEEALQRNEALLERNQVLLEKSQILIENVIESVDSLARIACPWEPNY